MSPRALPGWLLDRWFAAISPARLRLFERVFTCTFMAYCGAWFAGGEEWLTTRGFHFTAELTSSSYPAPLPPLPPAWLPYFAVLLFGAPLCVVLGVLRRPALAVTLGCAVYIQLVDVYSAFTLNKLYILGFLLLLLAPPPVQGRQSAWPARIIQATLLIQYFTAGLCKVLHGDWLKHDDILIGHSVGLYRTELAAWMVQTLPHWTWVAQHAFALGFELLAPALFLVPHLRRVGIALGFGMHLLIALLMQDLIWFSAQMVSFYLLFARDETAERAEALIGRLGAALRARLARRPAAEVPN